MVTDPEVANARREWEDGHRRLLDQAREAGAADGLLAQVDVVAAELRRRVGGVFTLRELAGAYVRSDEWSRAVVSEQAPAPGWPRTLALVEAAAFHLYSRGAQDYEP